MEKEIYEKLGKEITREEIEELKDYYNAGTDEEMIEKIDAFNITINDVKINGKKYEVIAGDAWTNENSDGPFYAIYLRSEKRWATDEEEKVAEF